MSFGLSKFLKNILPKQLFYRGLLIVATPIIILQITISLVFFDSLWIKTNKGMTRALVSEIQTFIEVYISENGCTHILSPLHPLVLCNSSDCLLLPQVFHCLQQLQRRNASITADVEQFAEEIDDHRMRQRLHLVNHILPIFYPCVVPRLGPNFLKTVPLFQIC